MIQLEDILNLNFYKKEKFSGSYLGMRYRIEKDSENEEDIFRVYRWAGPYNFATTKEEKISATFPFTLEGKQQVVDWLNEQWQSKKDEWPHL